MRARLDCFDCTAHWRVREPAAALRVGTSGFDSTDSALIFNVHGHGVIPPEKVYRSRAREELARLDQAGVGQSGRADGRDLRVVGVVDHGDELPSGRIPDEDGYVPTLAHPPGTACSESSSTSPAVELRRTGIIDWHDGHAQVGIAPGRQVLLA